MIKAKNRYKQESLKIGLNDRERLIFFKALHRTKNSRAILLWTLIGASGLRISEALSLTVGEIVGKTRVILRVKGQIRRKIYFNAGIQELVTNYMETRETIRPTDPLFVSRHNTRLSVRQAQREFLNLLDMAKIENTTYKEEAGEKLRHVLTPHSLRHMAGRIACRKLGPAVAAKRLGITKEVFTARYDDVTAEDEQAAADINWEAVNSTELHHL